MSLLQHYEDVQKTSEAIQRHCSSIENNAMSILKNMQGVILPKQIEEDIEALAKGISSSAIYIRCRQEIFDEGFKKFAEGAVEYLKRK